MDGGKISNLWRGEDTKDTVHYLIQFATFAVVAVLLILVIALFAHLSKVGKTAVPPAERLSNKNKVTAALRRAGSGTLFGTEGLITAAQQRREVIRGLQTQEHMNSAQIKRQLSSSFEHMSQEERVRRGLASGSSGLGGQEHFINHMPMLGGAKLTDGAVAMRAADPIASEPLSPSQQQYMKENELLEHLLYK